LRQLVPRREPDGFTGHHALLCRLHRDRITGFGTAVADLDERVAGKAARWQRETDLLKSLPGFGDIVAWAWLGEIGPAPHLHFSSHEKLASWVSLCPGNHISAQARPDRGRRDLYQADAVPGRLGRDPGPGSATGPVQPAGTPLRR
jgi:transposase